MPTFVYMNAKSTLTIRAGKDYNGLIAAIELLAKMDGRTTNNYVVRLLDQHVKKQGAKKKK